MDLPADAIANLTLSDREMAVVVQMCHACYAANMADKDGLWPEDPDDEQRLAIEAMVWDYILLFQNNPKVEPIQTSWRTGIRVGLALVLVMRKEGRFDEGFKEGLRYTSRLMRDAINRTYDAPSVETAAKWHKEFANLIQSITRSAWETVADEIEKIIGIDPLAVDLPAGWWHAFVHLNPETGELQSGQDVRVQTWLEAHTTTPEGSYKADMDVAGMRGVLDAILNAKTLEEARAIASKAAR